MTGQPKPPTLVSSHTSNPSDITHRNLRLMLEAMDKMLTTVYGGRKQAINSASEVIRKLFNVENCSIFLVPPTDPNWLELHASSNESWTPEPGERLRLPLHVPNKKSLTANLARLGEPKILDYRELRTPQFASKEDLRHLSSGDRFSVMTVPLCGEDGKVEVFLKCENKKGKLGKAAPDVGFTEEELEMAVMLAEKVKLVLFMASAREDMDVLETAGELMLDIQKKRGRDELLGAIIARAVRLLRADRGDFAWWTAEKGDLVYAAHNGETKSKNVAVNKLVPQESFMWHVFTDRNSDSRIAHDLHDRKQLERHPYTRAHPRTRSELAVRVVLGGNPVGVLNVESFKKEWFNERDADVLRIIARHAALAVQMVQSDGLVRDALQHTGEPEMILMPILEGVLEACGFDEGILYRVDKEKRLLRVAASRHGADVTFNPRDFTHSLDEPSLAGWVYEKAPIDDPQPEIVEAPMEDARVHKRALRKWKIRGSVMGYPLDCKGERVGCLILWCRNRPFPLHPNKPRLDDFAKLAATKIALWQAERATFRSRQLFERLADNSQLMVFTKLASLWKPRERRPKFECPGNYKIAFDYANRRFLDYVGLNHISEIQGKTDWDFFPDLALDYYNDDLKVLQNHIVTDQEESNTRPRDGAARRVVVWKTPLYEHGDTEGRALVSGIQVVFWDCTKHREVEEERKILLEAVRHRARDSLIEVGGFLAIEQHHTKNPTVRHILHDARLRIQNMEVLFNLLYANRPHTPPGKKPGLHQVEMKPFLGTLMNAVAGSFKHRRRELRIDLEVSGITNATFPEDTAKYCGIIATELVSNAYEHAFLGLKRGKVTVALTRRSKDRYELSVTDDGRGSERKQGKGGEPLGLDIIKRLATRQLGGIGPALTPAQDSQSRPGVRCSIVFPLKPPLQRQNIAKLRNANNPRSVLLVEDKEIDAMQYKLLLDNHGLHVFPPVKTREKAIEAAHKWQPKVIIMDICLGDRPDDHFAGLEAAEAIREQSDVPIIFLTSVTHEHPQLKNRIKKLGAHIQLKGTNIDDNLLWQVNVALEQQFGRKIFVCYSHKDQRYCNELLRHIETLRRPKEDIEVWSDKKIVDGEEWHKRIQDVLDQSVAAVVLVSADFMNSEYIQRWELPKLLARAKSNKTSLFLVQIHPCNLNLPDDQTLEIRQFVRGTLEKPIGQRRDKSDREKVWFQITKEIEEALTRREVNAKLRPPGES